MPWPRDRLDEAIAACRDSKSLIALLWLKSHPRRLTERWQTEERHSAAPKYPAW